MILIKNDIGETVASADNYKLLLNYLVAALNDDAIDTDNHFLSIEEDINPS